MRQQHALKTIAPRIDLTIDSTDLGEPCLDLDCAQIPHAGKPNFKSGLRRRSGAVEPAERESLLGSLRIPEQYGRRPVLKLVIALTDDDESLYELSQQELDEVATSILEHNQAEEAESAAYRDLLYGNLDDDVIDLDTMDTPCASDLLSHELSELFRDRRRHPRTIGISRDPWEMPDDLPDWLDGFHVTDRP